MRSLLLQILFQSTPLMRGETLRLTPVAALICAFQSTPLSRGGTLTAELTSCDLTTFQSAPLSRGETRDPHSRRAGGGDFNPLPSHEGRPAAGDLLFSAPVISIHSPHAREDLLLRDARSDSGRISIHSPHTRGDRHRISFAFFCINFNPLPSYEGRQHKPPKIHPDLRQLTQQNHDTPLFGALQAPFCFSEPDIRGAKPMGKP